jgi:DNA repair protein radC
MGVHDGHRERLRARFAEHGLESFNELNALELLLCYAIPRRDTNELAHRLLDAFGSLSGVFQASMQELTSIPGIGENAAMLILMVPQIVKKAHVSKAKETKIIRNSTDAGNYLLPYFLDEQDEIVMMLCLDNKRAVICCREMGRGVVNCVDANIRRMVETALKVKTTTVIIAHNHPNGVALPSREDDNFTRTLYRSLGLLGITLEDHIIVANDEFVSLADSGVMHLFKY